MTKDDAIINPAKGKRSPSLGPVAAMVSNEADLRCLCNLLNMNEDNFSSLLMSRLYVGEGYTGGFSVAGPFIGASYTTILFETLIAWGARKFLLLGWCGAVSNDIKIGDIIVPKCSIIDEGTSKHYNSHESAIIEDNKCLAHPSVRIVEKTKEALNDKGIPFHEGVIWSTDAIFRETREKVEHFQKRDVLAVEMETSAIFTVGKFREVEVSGILVVSDELATFKWRTGFKDKRFEKSRKTACEVISGLWKRL